MKAAVFYAPHVPVSIEELEIEAPHAGEVLIDMVCVFSPVLQL